MLVSFWVCEPRYMGAVSVLQRGALAPPCQKRKKHEKIKKYKLYYKIHSLNNSLSYLGCCPNVVVNEFNVLFYSFPMYA